MRVGMLPAIKNTVDILMLSFFFWNFRFIFGGHNAWDRGKKGVGGGGAEKNRLE